MEIKTVQPTASACFIQFAVCLLYFAWHKNSINDLCPNQLESNELYLMS